MGAPPLALNGGARRRDSEDAFDRLAHGMADGRVLGLGGLLEAPAPVGFGKCVCLCQMVASSVQWEAWTRVDGAVSCRFKALQHAVRSQSGSPGADQPDTAISKPSMPSPALCTTGMYHWGKP